MLDHAARVESPLSQAELLNVAKSAGVIADDGVRELLNKLAMDHYLSKDLSGRYAFRNGLFRRWWIMERGLNP